MIVKWPRILMIAMLLTSIGWGKDRLKVGDKVPNLIGRTLENSLYRLSTDTEKPKVINFFWIGCQPCRMEILELVKMEQKYPTVKFIFVHTKDEALEDVKRFIASLGSAPANIVLSADSVRERFLFVGFPSTIIVDNNNSVLANFTGYTSANMNQLETIVSNLDQSRTSICGNGSH